MRAVAFVVLALIAAGCAGQVGPTEDKDEGASNVVQVAVVSAYNYSSPAGLRVVGEVENQGAGAIETVRVNAVFYGTRGEVLGAQSGFAHIWHVRGGERAPYSLSIAEKTESELASVNVTVSAEGAPERAFVPLRLSSVQNQTLPDGNMVVSGLVTNEGARHLRSVEVVAVFLDQEGRIVVVDDGFTSPMDLAPGESGAFEVRTYHERPAAARVLAKPETE